MLWRHRGSIVHDQGSQLKLFAIIRRYTDPKGSIVHDQGSQLKHTPPRVAQCMKARLNRT